nr:hypothetical protein CFP56_03836 [Quercus suber]
MTAASYRLDRADEAAHIPHSLQQSLAATVQSLPRCLGSHRVSDINRPRRPVEIEALALRRVLQRSYARVPARELRSMTMHSSLSMCVLGAVVLPFLTWSLDCSGDCIPRSNLESAGATMKHLPRGRSLHARSVLRSATAGR